MGRIRQQLKGIILASVIYEQYPAVLIYRATGYQFIYLSLHYPGTLKYYLFLIVTGNHKIQDRFFSV